MDDCVARDECDTVVLMDAIDRQEQIFVCNNDMYVNDKLHSHHLVHQSINISLSSDLGEIANMFG